MTSTDFENALHAIEQLFQNPTISPLVADPLDLAEAPHAHKLANSGHATGKITLTTGS